MDVFLEVVWPLSPAFIMFSLSVSVGGPIAGEVEGVPTLAMPSGVYGITMYFVTLPLFLIMRRRV